MGGIVDPITVRVKLFSKEVHTGIMRNEPDPDYIKLVSDSETVYLPRKEIKSYEPLLPGSNIIFLADRAP